ncbi:MAG: triose-phosphate isomerase [Candidatus Accumulibacter sp.]|jgi:triosephosphate isomerase|nr:triose-phosphate isomerase [Accumulibacter sp.]
MRRLVAGTGWKMNNGIAASRRYAEELKARIAPLDTSAIDIYVLPPFTSLAAAAQAFAGSPVAVGGQNMHWEDSGSWTGEISAPMLLEAGCRYVELAHSERLQHFGETYAQVRRKVDKAMSAGLVPVVCLGESAPEKAEGRADAVLAGQLLASIDGQPDERIPEIILAYEPRWAIGAAEAASPSYVEERHRALRAVLREHRGESVAERTRIIYGGSVTPENGGAILALGDVDGLFVGRAAWEPGGFARIVELVAGAAKRKAAARKP